MTLRQILLERLVWAQQKAAGTFVADEELPRYYAWVERPRTPDFEGGEPPVVWTRQDRGGHL